MPACSNLSTLPHVTAFSATTTRATSARTKKATRSVRETRMSTSNRAGARARRRVARDRVVSMGGIKMKMRISSGSSSGGGEMLLRCAITRSRADDGSNERVDY